MNTYKIVTSTISFEVTACDSDFACWNANSHLKNEGITLKKQRAKLFLIATDLRGEKYEELIGDFTLEGFTPPATWRDICELKKDVLADAKKDAGSNWNLPVVRSRGAVLVAEDAKGETLLATGDCWDMPKTLKGFKTALATIKSQFPTAAKVFICIGCDAAESVRALNDGDYTPWAGEAQAVVHAFTE